VVLILTLIGRGGIVQSQAADLKKPPRTFEEIVGALAKLVPDFAASVLKQAKQ
jgi:hypothetical protein